MVFQNINKKLLELGPSLDRFLIIKKNVYSVVNSDFLATLNIDHTTAVGTLTPLMYCY